jgi:hypothetical protein
MDEADVDKVLREGTAAPHPAFVVVFRVGSEFNLADEIPFNIFAGLRFCQVLAANGGGARVYTVWSTKTHFHVVEAVFTEWLKEKDSTAEFEWGAYQRQAASKKSSWWSRPMNYYVVFVSIGTLFGVVEVIRNHYEELFIKPDIACIAPPEGYNALVGEPFRPAFSVHNNALRGTCSVLVKKVVFESANGTADPEINQSPFEELRLPSMAAGDDQSVPIEATPVRAGQYRMIVKVSAKAGELRRESHSSFKYQVTVWDAMAIGDVSLHEGWRGQRAEFVVPIKVGRRYGEGLRFHARLLRGGDTYFHNVFSAKLGELRDRGFVPDQGQEVSWIVFDTQPVGPMQEILVTLVLHSKTPKMESDWRQIAQNITVTDLGPEKGD